MIKVVVLYPAPKDSEAFERDYTQSHLPLIRELLDADVPLPTCKVVNTADGTAPFYRVAEIHFRDREQLDALIRSGKSEAGRKSSHDVATGGGAYGVDVHAVHNHCPTPCQRLAPRGGTR